MADPKEVKAPEIKDLDLTQKLLTIAHHSASDAALRATHAAARTQLAKLNQVIQDEVDKQRAEAAKAAAAEEAKAAEEARLAKRKAEDEEAAATKKTEAKHPVA